MNTLSSSPLALGSIENAITGAGQLDRRHRDRLVAGRQPVAGAGLLELGDGADVAGAELGPVWPGLVSPSNVTSWPIRSLLWVRVLSTCESWLITPW